MVKVLIQFKTAKPTKGAPPNTITLGISISTYEFRRDKNIQSIEVPRVVKFIETYSRIVFIRNRGETEIGIFI